MSSPSSADPEASLATVFGLPPFKSVADWEVTQATLLRCPPTPCSVDLKSWLAAAFKPVYENAKPREYSSLVNPYHVAARPLDHRHLPFAIVKNTQMIPALLQNLRDYSDSPSAQRDFTPDRTLFESIEAKKNVMKFLNARNDGDSERELEMEFHKIVEKLLQLVGQQRVKCCLHPTVESVGVQTCEWYKCADDDVEAYPDYYWHLPPPSATILCLVHWLSLSKKDDAFYDEMDEWEPEDTSEMVDTMLDKIGQMADQKRVFDHINSPYVWKEDSLVVRVRSGKEIFLFHLTNDDTLPR
jgi:hypothetical protein